MHTDHATLIFNIRINNKLNRIDRLDTFVFTLIQAHVYTYVRHRKNISYRLGKNHENVNSRVFLRSRYFPDLIRVREAKMLH